MKYLELVCVSKEEMACFFHQLVMFLLYMQQEMIRLPGRY